MGEYWNMPGMGFTYRRYNIELPLIIFYLHFPFVTLSRLPVVSLFLFTLVTTPFYFDLILIYSGLYLQATLSHYHRTRLRVSLIYIPLFFIHYLLSSSVVDILTTTGL
jgi:hypothetical protein